MRKTRKMVSLLCAVAMMFVLATQTEAAILPDVSLSDAEYAAEMEKCGTFLAEMYGNSQNEIMQAIGKNVSISNFGGLYRDEDGSLVVNVVDPDQLDEAFFAFACGYTEPVVFKKVTYSLALLEDAVDKLVPYMREYDMITLDADDKENRLKIEVADYSEKNQERLWALIDALEIPATCIDIINRTGLSAQCTVGYVEDCSSQDSEGVEDVNILFSGLFPGSRITVKSFSYTLGPYRNGYFFTAGHKFPYWESITYHPSGVGVPEVIGSAYNGHFGGTADVALITLNHGYQQASVYSYTFKEPMVGDQIAMFGATSFENNVGPKGVVTAVNVEVYYKDLDTTVMLAQGDYSCMAGDSGGPVFNDITVSDSHEVTTCYGVQSGGLFNSNGTWSGKSYFTTADNMLIWN